jgi:hypothetical protein
MPMTGVWNLKPKRSTVNIHLWIGYTSISSLAGHNLPSNSINLSQGVIFNLFRHISKKVMSC